MKRSTLLIFSFLMITLIAAGCTGRETTSVFDKTTTTVATGTTASDTAASNTTASTTPFSEEDSDFIEGAARDGMAEVDLGGDAVTRATDPEVKAFAQMMVADHSKANDELAALASSHSLTMPTELEASLREAKVKLMALTGKGFDQAFIDQMVLDHTNTIRKFEEQSSRGADPELKMWVDEKLPKLREHLEEAQILQARLKK